MPSNYLNTGMNNSWNNIDKENIWHPYSPLKGIDDNILITAASGVYLHTADGRKIIDAISSWWVNLHGHSNPYIANAIAEQAKKLEHVIFAGFTHEPAITLSERLLKILPGEQTKIFYSDNGSTAVEVAIKLALQYHHNQGEKPGKIAALQGSFHGDTFGAMAVGERGLFNKPFHNYLFEVCYLDLPSEENEDAAANQLEELAKKENISAFIYEPLVQGASGMRIYPKKALEKILAVAKKNNIICIADEVMTGFGRTGKLFASEYMHEKPDIICLSKGITGGFLPLGATTCNSKIISGFDTADKSKAFYHGHSYTANPISCAAANASLDLLLGKECLKKIESISASHLDFAKKINTHPKVSSVKTLGTILSIEIMAGDESGYLNSQRDYIYNFCLSKNTLLRPLGNIVYILPPYVIEENELLIVYNTLLELLKSI